jgi:hypothetical protein
VAGQLDVLLFLKIRCEKNGNRISVFLLVLQEHSWKEL